MKKLFNWQVGLGLTLVLLSALVYTVHYLVFHDAHHLFMFLVGDIAFVFIEVLLVTMILHRLLEHREKQAKLKKLNMVIGSFFSDVGTELLQLTARFDKNIETTRDKLLIDESWNAGRYSTTTKELGKVFFNIDPNLSNLEELKLFFKEKRYSLLRIMENPNMLEHDHFTDMLLAVLHLGEELTHREAPCNGSDEDQEHIAGDIERAYTQLLCQWLEYMNHLRVDYPYLYSLACRTNPFNPNAQVEI